MHTVEGDAAFCGDGVPEAVVEAFRGNYRKATAGPPAYEDDLLSESTAARWRSGCQVYHERDLSPREQVVRSPFYQSVLRPNAVRHVAGLSLSLNQGEVSLVFGFERADVAGMTEHGMARLRLLASSFEAGVRAQMQAGRQRTALGRMLDGLGTPLLLVAPDGQLTHRNRACRDAVDADGLTSVMLQWARRVLQRNAARSSPPTTSVRVGPLQVRYRLWASTVSEEVVGRAALLVGADRQDVALPSVRQIQDRHGLTPRQAEVALLMARGLTTPEVAERLTISIHTARTHCERVLARLDLSSRAGVAVALLSGRG